MLHARTMSRLLGHGVAAGFGRGSDGYEAWREVWRRRREYSAEGTGDSTNPLSRVGVGLPRGVADGGTPAS